MEDVRLRSSGRSLDESRQIVRRNEVVGVEEHEQLALRERDASITCRRDATSSQVVDRDSSGEAGKQLRGAVGRPIVDHDQLRANVLLREHALDRIGDERLPVPDGMMTEKGRFAIREREQAGSPWSLPAASRRLTVSEEGTPRDGQGAAEPGAKPGLRGQHVPDLPGLTRIGPEESRVTPPKQILHVPIQCRAVDEAELGQGLCSTHSPPGVDPLADHDRAVEAARRDLPVPSKPSCGNFCANDCRTSPFE